MKIVLPALAASLLFAACSPTPQPAAAPAPASTSTPAAAAPAQSKAATPSAQILAQYHWQLTGATDAAGQRIASLFAPGAQALQLDFTATDVAVSNTCNAMHGSYRIADGKISFGPLASTMKACANPALQARDQTVGATLQGSLSIGFVPSAAPRLTLRDAAGNQLVFHGQETAEQQYGGAGQTMFLEVAAEDTTCKVPFMPSATCPNVREVHFDAKGLATGTPGPWHGLLAPIEGYHHEPGVRNVLRVKRYQTGNDPGVASSSAYVLDLVVQTELPKAK